jgi:hypothetical protein
VQVVAGLLLLAAILAGGYWLYRTIRLVQHRRRALLEIRNATSAAALHLALLNFETGHAENKYLTLQQWLNGMQQKYKVNENLYLLVRKLEQMQYGLPATGSVAELAQDAARLLRKLPLKKLSRKIA